MTLKKKRIILIIILAIIIISVIIIGFLCNKKEEKKLSFNSKSNNNLTILLENDNGNVRVQNFPTESENYYFDKVECDNLSTATTSKLYIWKDNKLNFNLRSTTKIDGELNCQVYFKPFMPTSEYSVNSTANPYHTFTAPRDGIYKIELWGAQGGTTSGAEGSVAGNIGGYGGYVSGEIVLNSEDVLNITVGGQGKVATATNQENTKGYNGGGISGYEAGCGTSCMKGAGGGGGATDVRYDGTELINRIMVAGGGGGAANWNSPKAGGGGGGLIGITGDFYRDSGSYSYTNATGGNQIIGGAAGVGGSAGTNGNFGVGGNAWQIYGGGGGGGYYGGGGGSVNSSVVGSGAGGSSYISGHTGCVAVQEGTSTPKTGCTTETTNNSCSIHYSNKKFNNTVMIDGAGYSWSNTKGGFQQMPSTTEGNNYSLGVGRSGDGYARITQVKNSTDFVYTNKYQKYVVPKTGIYKIELWGAQGGSVNSTYFGGYGGYTSGELTFNANDELYFYVGGTGSTGTPAVVATYPGGYNGGGNGYVNRAQCTQTAASGGGATDVRLVSGNWDDAASLRSRIMVAGAGGGSYTEYCSTSDSAYIYGGMAGGLTGKTPLYISRSGYSSLNPIGGNQINGGQGLNAWTATSYVNEYTGTFGKGGTGGNSYSGGGSGYYGGASGVWQPGAGGSSYISGYTGCVAVEEGTTTPISGCDNGTTNNSCSIHYSNKKFTNAVMIDGMGYNEVNKIENDSWALCSAENGTCSLSGVNMIRYGSGDTFNYKIMKDAFTCNNTIFGDPTPGVAKNCYYKAISVDSKPMPNPLGGNYDLGTGHTGSGYARITYIGGI